MNIIVAILAIVFGALAVYVMYLAYIAHAWKGKETEDPTEDMYH